MPRIDPTLLPVVTDLERGLRELGIPFGNRCGGVADLLPFSASIAPTGRLELEAGLVLNMAGFEAVVPNVLQTVVDGGPTLPLAPLPLYALLKLVAFSDRKQFKDLAGVFH